ncbi:cupin domain-containing protein [Deferribacter autotrophicus]|uniref:Cupin domain-containing protein n=1 Tax=Deferribacter autotrophicus TaxID=500465 RepID=A0A5A8F247_9BACT|nr:phosphate acyltransferase [Deferribacter autotrophicus]KAA0257395.1 cupin domain-containing protein [Deferribacter autotrophicus]
MLRSMNKYGNIGKNITEILVSKNIDKSELSKLLGITDDEIDAILKNEIQPSVSQLLKLSAFLSVDIPTILFGESYEDKKVAKTTPEERIVVKRKDYLVYESLAPKYSSKAIEPFVVDIYKTKDYNVDESVHNGEEFIYVMEGKIRMVIDGKEYLLDAGDTIYFDSSLKHKIESITDKSKIFAALYYGSSMLLKTKGKKMKDLIQAAKIINPQNIVVINPDKSSLDAVNKAIAEGIINKVYLVGNKKKLEKDLSDYLIFQKHYVYEHIDDSETYFQDCTKKGIELIKEGKVDFIMKGNINTAIMLKEILNKKTGIPSMRRLSLVSIFELYDREKFILLTDPAINTELFPGGNLDLSKDIINNAIDVAKAIGISDIKVALLEANEIPTEKIPSTILDQELSKLKWEDAVVYGPLSYDLALYPDAVEKKGLKDNPVAGNADILVVPHIEAGNFLYKSWAMTMGADVANVVVGAKVPIVITSRSDSDMVKFLTICANAIFANYLSIKNGND